MLRFFPPLRRFSLRRPHVYETVTGLSRLAFLLLVSTLIFSLVCIHRLEGMDVWQIAEQIRPDAPSNLAWIPTLFWLPLVPFQKWAYFRYLIAPWAAFLTILLSGGFYVKDIYHLPFLHRGLHYVFSSLFAIFYPQVQVDSGRVDGADPDDNGNLEERNLLVAVGGPGFAYIRPGNAVAFRDWRGNLGVQSGRRYFMRPFEMIARAISLEDQHGHIDELAAVTRDGIRVRLRNIDYRFCILSDEKYDKKPRGERAAPRARQIPYPYSVSAMETVAYSLAVTDKGLEPWQQGVRRVLNGALLGFIGTHELDYLTAPRQDGQNPRRELRLELFAPALQGELRKVGAELHWMDIGFFDIDPMGEEKTQDPVDGTRTNLWVARWVGDAKTVRSFGEGVRLAFQEIGRAEAQAEMIMAITEAMRNVDLGPDRAEALRRIFLARTAQILEALRDGKDKEKRRPPNAR